MERALAGLKVLDLTMNLPGPYMTWLIAVMGGEVVKVENPVGGDYARALGGGGEPGNSPAFAAVNRNKKSLALNLKAPEGRDLFFRLLDDYDVVVEGFRPGVMANLGLDYHELAARQPRLIQVSISGYGQTGPYRLRAGHDVNYLAQAGILSLIGDQSGRPAIPGVQVADVAGGSLMALIGLLAAVNQRHRTGRGQWVDAAMFDGVFSLATMVFGMVDAGLDQPGPGRMMLNGRLPCYNVYPTADGRYMALGALEPKFWVNFCRAVDREDLIPGQFGGPEVLDEAARIFGGRTQAEWVDFLADVDCCCEAVLTLDEAARSPLAASKNLVNRDAEGNRYLAPPLCLSDSPNADHRPAPALGADTRDVLLAAGLTRPEIDDLAKRGVIGL